MQQQVYGLVELSKAVDKHDKMFMTFAKVRTLSTSRSFRMNLF